MCVCWYLYLTHTLCDYTVVRTQSSCNTWPWVQNTHRLSHHVCGTYKHSHIHTVCMLSICGYGPIKRWCSSPPEHKAIFPFTSLLPSLTRTHITLTHTSHTHHTHTHTSHITHTHTHTHTSHTHRLPLPHIPITNCWHSDHRRLIHVCVCERHTHTHR